MNIRKKILILIGIGMLLPMAVTAFLLRDITLPFFPAAKALGERTGDEGAGVLLLLSAAPIACAVFLLAFGIYLHRRVSVPLSELLKGAEEISRGNLDHRVRARGTREVEELGERLNELAVKLRQTRAELDRPGDMGQLGSAIRHEINNPLSTVIGNVELLMERYEDRDKELVMRLDTVLNSALRIAEIVKRAQDLKRNIDANTQRHDNGPGSGKAEQ